MNGTAPVTKDASKKRRLIPPEQSSLAEQTAREIALQYLLQRPENLGKIINELPQEKRWQAVDGIDEGLFLRRKDVIPANGNREIQSTDTITFIGIGSIRTFQDDIVYGTVAFHTLPTHLQGVFEFVFRAWKARSLTDDDYRRNSESDGSASINISEDFESISDEIRAHVESLREDYQDQLRRLQHDEEEDPEMEFDESDLEDAVIEELTDYFYDVEQLRTDPERFRDNRCRYGRTPLMTVRLPHM